MKRPFALIAAALTAITLTVTAAAASATPAASAPSQAGICGGLPVYRASGHESMMAWANAHHAHVSTIILSTMDYCTKSGRPIILRIIRQMDQYVDRGNQRLVMPRGMIFTSPPQAQHRITTTARAYTCKTIQHVASGAASLVTWVHRHGQLMDEALYFSFYCGNGGTLSRPGGFTLAMVRYLDGRASVTARMPKGLVFWSAMAAD